MKDGTSEGISSWLFIGQLFASVGFKVGLTYSEWSADILVRAPFGIRLFQFESVSYGWHEFRKKFPD